MTELPQQNPSLMTRLSQQGRNWAILIARAGQAALAPESSLIAASIGYFTLFSLFPLTLMTVAIASLWLDPLLAESEIVTQLEFIAPALGELLGANIEQIVRARGPITGLAAVILLWSSSNIFNVITRALDQIWQVDKSRPTWQHRGLAILMALVLIFVLLFASFAGGTMLSIVNILLPGELQVIRPYAIQFWGAMASVLIFTTLYYFLPHMSMALRDVLPGAIAAGLLWDLAKRGFLFFVFTYLSRSNLVYGSVATITAFLTWAFLSSIILLFGAHLNVQYARSKT